MTGDSDLMKSFRKQVADQSYLIMIFYTFYMKSMLFSQERGYTISGTITDHNDQPISYVNVFLKGSVVGDMTDKSGAFFFSTKDTRFDTLICRHISFEEVRIRLAFDEPVAMHLSIKLKEKSR